MGLTLDEGLEKAEECLDELVAVQSRAAVDMFYAMMEPLHSSTWQVLADESGLARLRELNKRYALVFLPAHRSYVDTLVLGDVLARNDFPRNHVMGGANLRIWPISDLARRAGIVFIRRSFGDDEIYKAVVQEYFAFLLSKRFNLEWYFEGGRSRTGKIRSPALRPAAVRRPGRAERPGRGRLPGADLDHLRPSPRGLQDGGRAGRGEEAGRGAEVAGRSTPAPSGARTAAPPTSGSASRSRSARGCHRPAPRPRTTAPRSTRSPSRSRSASTAPPR